MTNDQIADCFSLLSKLMDIHDENSFKIKSYSIAAYNIEKLPAPAIEMSQQELFAQKGIGDSTGKKILEIINTGKLDALEEIIARTPPGILEMLHIKGLGPKKIGVIWHELGIESLGELEYACQENRLVTLKGFGAKTQESVLQNIAYLNQNKGYFLWADAHTIAQSIIDSVQKAMPNIRFEMSGALKRQIETMNVIEFITDGERGLVDDFFKALGQLDAVETSEPSQSRFKMQSIPEVCIYYVSKENFALESLQLSGAEDFVAGVSEYIKDTAGIQTEVELFEKNGIQFIVPALREDKSVWAKAKANSLPNLIQPGDIKGIIHSHSKWSDGVHSLAEMASAAMKKGLEYLVISDHSQSAFYANGLKPERVAEQHAEIDMLNQKLVPFKIFKSIESDILNDGSLDYTDSVLSTFDLVIASVHSNLKMSEEKAMMRLMNAIENPYTTILGHPTGRLLLSRKGYPIDHKAIIDACVKHNVVVEINAHPRRLDLDWRWVEYAMEAGALLSVNPDAHSVEGYKDVYYGVMAAQKGGLTKNRNLSSFSLAELTNYLKNRG